MSDVESNAENLNRAATILRDADGLLICAGAGMGVESGLPDLNGNQGFWKKFPASTCPGYESSTVASPRIFEVDPSLAWGFYGYRLNLYRQAVPDIAFGILHRWAQRMHSGWFVVTSNVDGQFQKAGFDDLRIHELNGSIHRLQCTKPCSNDIWSAADFQPEVDNVEYRLSNAWPTCPQCGRLARPQVLMFGDWQWNDAPTLESRREFQRWVNQAKRVAIVEIGASIKNSFIRMFSESLGRNSQLIRINTRDADLPDRLHGVAIEGDEVFVLQMIDEILSDS